MKINFSENFTFSNIVSTISLFFSITALVIVSKISALQTISDIDSSRPYIIKQDLSEKIQTQERKNVDNSSYDNVLKDMDVLIDNVDKEIYNPDEEDYSNSSKNKSFSVDSVDYSKLNDDKNSPKKKTSNNYINDGELAPIPMPKNISDANRANNSKSNANQLSANNSNSTNANSINNMNSSNENSYLNNSDYPYKIQLAAFKTRTEAVVGWMRIKKKSQGALSDTYFISEPNPNVSESSLYTLYTFAKTNSEAHKICDLLKQKGIECQIKANN